MGLDARLVYFDFACLPVLCLFLFALYYRKNQVVTIFCKLKKSWEERRQPMEMRTKTHFEDQHFPFRLYRNALGIR